MGGISHASRVYLTSATFWMISTTFWCSIHDFSRKSSKESMTDFSRLLWFSDVRLVSFVEVKLTFVSCGK